MAGGISIHAVDVASGRPAQGLRVEIWRIDPDSLRIADGRLGANGVLDHPVAQGAGVTAGSFVVHPSVERIVICEIEPLIPKIVAEYFAEENYGVVRDKKVEIVFDDARHYILTTREKFDIITSDPINAWDKGAA